MLVDDLCEISKRGGDDIVLANYLLDVFIIEPIFFRGSGVDVVIHDFAVWILLVRSVGEIKIAAIMAEAVIIGIHILPRPILGGQFAIAWIAVRDILAFVIVERPGETIAAFVQANLHRLHDGAIEGVNVLMRGEEQTNALLVVLLERFRIAGFFSELSHMAGGDLFHFMESDSIFGYLISGDADGIGHCEPVR